MGFEEPKLNLSPKVSDEIRKTTCYMCACRCGINVHMKEGKVAYIEGNRDHPVNKGVLCAKGSAGIMQHYSPARLKKPLKRVGERGEGKFEEIEWEEALETAKSWLAPVRAKDMNQAAGNCHPDQRDKGQEGKLVPLVPIAHLAGQEKIQHGGSLGDYDHGGQRCRLAYGFCLEHALP